MTRSDTASPSIAPVIRAAEPTDAEALARLCDLDGRSLGEGTVLVATTGGAVVAALSTGDGSVVADPFRFTLEAVEQLRSRAAELDPAPTGLAARSVAALAQAPARLALLVAALAFLALGASAATGQAAAKPGLPAGTWVGTGIAVGSDTQAGISSRFTARLRFRIVVGPTGRVSGTGAFSSDIVVTGEFPSIISSQATVKFTGTATSLVYTGLAKTRGTFDTVTRTLKPIALKQRLPIARAGACRASGSFTFNHVSFRWSAVREINGTCRT